MFLTPEILGVWVSAFLTLAIFSFLYKDNPVYKFAEHVFVGVSAGYTLILTYSGTLAPNLVQPLIKAARHAGLLAAQEVDPQAWTGWFRLGALTLGILMLMRLSPKWGWVSRWPLALLIGTYAALRMTGLAQADLVMQVNATMVPLFGKDLPRFHWQDPSVLNHWILVIGVFSVLIYFFFSLEQKGPLKHAAFIGTFFLMVAFGSSFGYTVLARISLLIGRVQDLYDFAERRTGYASIVCAVAVILFLVVWELRNRRKGSPETE
ncbi:MAG TPA: hypothetical protein VM492_18270 [Sumerlaeia bacterium]|nr:hypothetical protein [Sumerlaeia bacterium]